MGQSILMALGLVLIIEGVMPLANPPLWREMFRRVLAMTDGQIRFFGLLFMLLGVMLVLISD